jgi:hypothetical protein
MNYWYLAGKADEFLDLQKLKLLREFYQEHGATEQEWQQLGKALYKLALPIMENAMNTGDTQQEHPTVRSRDPNVCARCERADLAEQRRRGEE